MKILWRKIDHKVAVRAQSGTEGLKMASERGQQYFHLIELESLGFRKARISKIFVKL